MTSTKPRPPACAVVTFGPAADGYVELPVASFHQCLRRIEEATDVESLRRKLEHARSVSYLDLELLDPAEQEAMARAAPADLDHDDELFEVLVLLPGFRPRRGRDEDAALSGAAAMRWSREEIAQRGDELVAGVPATSWAHDDDSWFRVRRGAEEVAVGSFRHPLLFVAPSGEDVAAEAERLGFFVVRVRGWMSREIWARQETVETWIVNRIADANRWQCFSLHDLFFEYV